MIPAGVTLRIVLLTVASAIYTLPLPSTATPTGRYNSAAVAAPPSPEVPPVPLPAIVVIMLQEAVVEDDPVTVNGR